MRSFWCFIPLKFQANKTLAWIAFEEVLTPPKADYIQWRNNLKFKKKKEKKPNEFPENSVVSYFPCYLHCQHWQAKLNCYHESFCNSIFVCSCGVSFLYFLYFKTFATNESLYPEAAINEYVRRKKKTLNTEIFPG